jgi:hypothetical protein
MDFQVGGISDKTVIYGYASCVTLTSACTANYRPIISSERVPYMKKKESDSQTKKIKMWSCALNGAQQKNELASWPSVAI